jgi:hypothetical protein
MLVFFFFSFDTGYWSQERKTHPIQSYFYHDSEKNIITNPARSVLLLTGGLPFGLSGPEKKLYTGIQTIKKYHAASAWYVPRNKKE